MNEIDYEQEHPRELIKCVLVGDTGVGKTRLICAQALGAGLSSLPVGSNSHVHYPTVFAIDQYHVSEEIRERANFVVDGVEVSLRLWDTFGEHEFNRKFAYQNAHVILLCFSVNSPASFKNVNANWYPEIRRYCPRVPILLVGTQSDWRYMRHTLHNDTRSPRKSPSLYKRMQECALVTPDMGRQVAVEIGASSYYEASVVSMFGVAEVFDNAVRAALVHRRHTRFLSSQLKRVSQPQLQQPYLPKKPDPPKVTSGQTPAYRNNLKTLLDGAVYADVEFLVGGQRHYAHKVILSAASPIFAQLFQAKCLASSEDSLCLPIELVSAAQPIILQDALILGAPGKLPKGFEAIWEKHWDNHKILVIDVDNFIPHDVFPHILEFLYTSSLPAGACTKKLMDCARHLQLSSLTTFISNSLNGMEYMNSQVYCQMSRRMVSCTRELVNNKYLSDVAFHVDGSPIYTHKAFLVSQCEVLSAMFVEGHFKESGRHVVELGVANSDSFLAVLEFLYTGQWPSISVDNPTELLELANFFCLPRLLALCEQHIVKEIQVAMATDELAIAEDVIVFLREAQLHNASQLEEWCLHYLTTHYNDVCRLCPRELKSLNLATLKHLEEFRWPPMWYLLEEDWFNRTKQKQEESLAQHKSHRHLGRKKKCYCL